MLRVLAIVLLCMLPYVFLVASWMTRQPSPGMHGSWLIPVVSRDASIARGGAALIEDCVGCMMTWLGRLAPGDLIVHWDEQEGTHVISRFSHREGYEIATQCGSNISNLNVPGRLVMTLPRMGFVVSVLESPLGLRMAFALCNGAALVLLVIHIKRKWARQTSKERTLNQT